MSGVVLYSTNVFLKQFIQARFMGDLHYVWCSDTFDSATLGRYSLGALLPPSSNPVDIYRELKRDVDRGDLHSAKIAAQRASFISLATLWHASGHLAEEDRDDIAYMVNNAPLSHWRPLIYVIPRAPVESRLQLVPASKRAGIGDEYIIPDLQRNEFDLIEI